jgi:hypothetical protein
LLAEDAIKQAILNYKEKNPAEKAAVQEKSATQEKTSSQ